MHMFSNVTKHCRIIRICLAMYKSTQTYLRFPNPSLLSLVFTFSFLAFPHRFFLSLSPSSSVTLSSTVNSFKQCKRSCVVCRTIPLNLSPTDTMNACLAINSTKLHTTQPYFSSQNSEEKKKKQLFLYVLRRRRKTLINQNNNKLPIISINHEWLLSWNIHLPKILKLSWSMERSWERNAKYKDTH